jgi:hypothetical protein
MRRRMARQRRGTGQCMTDLSIGLWRHGYLAVSNDRKARGGGPTYSSRLLGRRTVVLGDGRR